MAGSALMRSLELFDSVKEGIVVEDTRGRWNALIVDLAEMRNQVDARGFTLINA